MYWPCPEWIQTAKVLYALLIVCHSLFEVVIEQIAERGKLVVAFVAVHTVIDCDIANITLGKKALGIIADFQIIAPHIQSSAVFRQSL